jgi:hypothetical protein
MKIITLNPLCKIIDNCIFNLKLDVLKNMFCY